MSKCNQCFVMSDRTIKLCYECLEKRIKELEAKAGRCLWTQDEDGIYDTDCDNRFELLEGTPKDNKMKYCPYCGKLITQALKGD